MSASEKLPNNARLLTKVVVGSRLHGLANEQSDYDYRGVFLHPLTDVLSPFRTLKNTHWIEGDNDNTAYEFADFIKLCVKGNPTALEVLWSDQVLFDTHAMQFLRKHRNKLLDSKAIYEAHKGYSHNQYKKMNLFDPDQRTPKFAVAYVRSLVQGIQLLERGTFYPKLEDYNANLAAELMQIKYDFDNYDKFKLVAIFETYMQKLNEAYAKYHSKWQPDTVWLEQYIQNVQADKWGLDEVKE